MDYKVHYIDVQNQLKNYIWLIEDLHSHEVIAIDPTEAHLVEEFCNTHYLTLSQIWLTHWHKDHIGGVPDLTRNRDIPVYGPQAELAKIPFITHPLENNAHFRFNNLHIDIISVPGHTLGHIVYFIKQIDSLFCGDTLFAMGCGRVFEGTYEQMYHSLNRLAALPSNTKVFCTHEYTLANAQFALATDPENIEIQQRLQHIETLRMLNHITLPSTIELELKTNPFLIANSVEDFKKLREWKDNF